MIVPNELFNHHIAFISMHMNICNFKFVTLLSFYKLNIVLFGIFNILYYKDCNSLHVEV